MNALYRMYRAADGYVFLAAPLPREWPALTKAMSPYVDLHADERFADAESRAAARRRVNRRTDNGFRDARPSWSGSTNCPPRTSAASRWWRPTPSWCCRPTRIYEAGYSVRAHSPIFEEHRRLAPLCRFSRSRTRADAGCTIGQHTDAVLREIGLDEATIVDLRATEIVGGS